MPQRKVTLKKDDKATAGRTAAAPSVVPEVASTSRSVNADKEKEKIIKERFHPSAVKYLQDVFGIDLNRKSITPAMLYDLAQGRMFGPVTATVNPVAKNKKTNTLETLEPISVVNSFIFHFPYDKKTKKLLPVDDEEHQVFVSSYPCYDAIMIGDGLTPAGGAKKAVVSEKETVSFTEEQMVALQGVGVQRNRLFSSYNRIPADIQKDMVAGKPFPVNGNVFIQDPNHDDRLISVPVNGVAKMRTMADGSVIADFEACQPKKLEHGQALDIDLVHRTGNVEIPIYKTDFEFKPITDRTGRPVLNQAGKDLVDYGISIGPVDAVIHGQAWDAKSGTYYPTRERTKVFASVVNGGLFIKKARMEPVLDKNNKPVKTIMNGKQVDKFRWVPPFDVPVNADGTVTVGTQKLSPASDYDLDCYKRGVGGVFKDFTYADKFKKGKKVSYDAFIIPNPQRGGMPKVFSEAQTERVLQRREEKAKKVQNFSRGI